MKNSNLIALSILLILALFSCNQTANNQSNTTDTTKTLVDNKKNTNESQPKGKDVLLKNEGFLKKFLTENDSFLIVGLKPIEGEGTEPYVNLTDDNGTANTDLKGYEIIGLVKKVENKNVQFVRLYLASPHSDVKHIPDYDNYLTNIENIRISANKCIKEKVKIYDHPNTKNVISEVDRKNASSMPVIEIYEKWLNVEYYVRGKKYTGWIRKQDQDPFPYGMDCD
jgi:hypothetical protein